MATELSVNVNAVAYLRNRRDLPWPSLLTVCRICLDAGAIGITVHPRPDERHIRKTDVYEIKELLSEPAYADKEFNVEGYPEERFLALCEDTTPNQVTFVPDDPAQATSDHGWDVAAHRTLLEQSVARMQAFGARVALFMDAEASTVATASSVGADRVELYTGPYGHTFDAGEKARKLSELSSANAAAVAAGLKVNAGHDLTVDNLPPLLFQAPQISEVSIGHALTADALIHGYEKAVTRFLTACRG